MTSVGFNKDGKWIFTASEDSTVKIWDVMGASSSQQEFKFSAAVTSAVLHPNQAEIVCGLQNGSLRVIDLVSNKVTRILGPDPESSLRSVAVSANGRFLACCNSSGTLYVWELPQTSCKELVSVVKVHAHESCILPFYCVLPMFLHPSFATIHFFDFFSHRYEQMCSGVLSAPTRLC